MWRPFNRRNLPCCCNLEGYSRYCWFTSSAEELVCQNRILCVSELVTYISSWLLSCFVVVAAASVLFDNCNHRTFTVVMMKCVVLCETTHCTNCGVKWLVAMVVNFQCVGNKSRRTFWVCNNCVVNLDLSSWSNWNGQFQMIIIGWRVLCCAVFRLLSTLARILPNPGFAHVRLFSLFNTNHVSRILPIRRSEVRWLPSTRRFQRRSR